MCFCYDGMHILLTAIPSLSFNEIVFKKVIKVFMWISHRFKTLTTQARKQSVVGSKLAEESFWAQHPLAEMHLERS